VSRFLSRFLTDLRVFTDDTAVVTNPTRGAFFAGCRAGSHAAALSSVHQTLPAASSGNKGSSAAKIARAFSIVFDALVSDASATPP